MPPLGEYRGMDSIALIQLVIESPAYGRLIDVLSARDAGDDRAETLCSCGCSVEAAAHEANELVHLGCDSVAATLFAFGRRPHAFPKAYRSMTALLVLCEAIAQGTDLDMAPEAIETILSSLKSAPRLDITLAWLETQNARAA